MLCKLSFEKRRYTVCRALKACLPMPLNSEFRFPLHKVIIPISSRLLAGDNKLSETVQLEQLLNEKTGVEDESRELDEEQKQLKLRAKMLTEKIIQELKKRKNAKQDSVT